MHRAARTGLIAAVLIGTVWWAGRLTGNHRRVRRQHARA